MVDDNRVAVATVRPARVDDHAAIGGVERIAGFTVVIQAVVHRWVVFVTRNSGAAGGELPKAGAHLVGGRVAGKSTQVRNIRMGTNAVLARTNGCDPRGRGTHRAGDEEESAGLDAWQAVVAKAGGFQVVAGFIQDGIHAHLVIPGDAIEAFAITPGMENAVAGQDDEFLAGINAIGSITNDVAVGPKHGFGLQAELFSDSKYRFARLDFVSNNPVTRRGEILGCAKGKGPEQAHSRVGKQAGVGKVVGDGAARHHQVRTRGDVGGGEATQRGPVKVVGRVVNDVVGGHTIKLGHRAQALALRPDVINTIHGQNVYLPAEGIEVEVVAQFVAVRPDDGFWPEAKFFGNGRDGIAFRQGVGNHLRTGHHRGSGGWDHAGFQGCGRGCAGGWVLGLHLDHRRGKRGCS